MWTKIKASGTLLLLLITLQSQVSQKKKSQGEINEILGTKEAKAITAQVFATDVVVQGSICVGFDCVNGENFGADTERLKENNLRIHFNDTSNSGGFPTNDWRIVINDQTNGGSSYFGIEDSDAGTYPFKVAAGAGNNALYIDAQGDVGLNTSNPVVELHIADGDSPTMRLEQSSSSGFTPQTWDVAGNETNFFVRDVTNGSQLPFKIKPGADDNSLFINSNNNIGLGTSSPAQKLDLRSSDPKIRLTNTNNSTGLPENWDFGSDTDLISIANVTAGTTPFKIEDGAPENALYIADSAVYIKSAILPGASAPSDIRLKRNVVTLADATSVIMQMTPRTYFYKEDQAKKYGLPSTKQYGLIAQELEKVIPELVSEKNFGAGEKYKTIDYYSLVPILIQGFKEQQSLIDQQNLKINKLEEKLSAYASLEKRIADLEAKNAPNQSSAKTNAKR